jgi:hypothetical protein
MRVFILKVCKLFSLSILLFIILYFVLPSFTFFKNNFPPPSFKQNLRNVDIIICGDSRADRQLDPLIMHELVKLNVINIATSSWDLYATSKCLKEADVSNKIIVISASYFQINDGAIDNGYFSFESFLDLSLIDKMKLYKHKPSQLISMQSRAFRNFFKGGNSLGNWGNYNRKLNYAFNKQSCSFFNINPNWFKSHPWYKSPKTDGVKQMLLYKALLNLSNLKNCKILIYNGPVSDKFLQLSKTYGVYELESNYDVFMYNACNKFGFIYHSFLQDTTFRSSDLYSNPQHLCEKGAVKFTSAIVDILYANRFLK